MKWIAGLLALSSTMGIAQAFETPALFDNSNIGVALSDEILGAQRGKFVAGPGAHYFGIEFVTTIAGPNGSILTSGMQLNVNFNRNKPTVGVNVYDANAETTTGNLSQNSPNGSGVVQLAQIAGNANTGFNELSFQTGTMPEAGMALSQGHYQLSLPEGMVRYEFSPSGMGLELTSGDGQVTAAQMVRSKNGSQGIVQQFSVAGNNQLLFNQAKFYMGDNLGAYGDLAQALRQQLPAGLK